MLRDAFGITGGPPEQVVLRFVPDVAPLVRERRWHATERVEPLEDGCVRLSMAVAVAPELREWILGFGGNVVVESPVSLAQWVRAEHLAAASRYG